MHLYLTRRSHLNSSYVNNDGQVLYKVETPFKFLYTVSTIKSALPRDIPAPGSSRTSDSPPSYVPFSYNDVKGDVEFDEEPDDDVDDDVDENDEPTQDIDRFAHLAEIKFGLTSAMIRYRGEEHETSKFFTKKEYGWNGRHRVFTGPDGLQYQWIFGVRVPELVRRNEARTPVARYHRRHPGIFGKARRGSLEIFPEGMHMVDLIVVTFVYIQKLRNDKTSEPN